MTTRHPLVAPLLLASLISIGCSTALAQSDRDFNPATKAGPQGETLDSVKQLPDWSGMWVNVSGWKHAVGEGKPPFKNFDIPFNKKGAAKFSQLKKLAEDDTYFPSRMERCLMLGIPGSTISPIVAWQFLFTPGQVTSLSPYNARKIYTDGRPHGTPAFRGGNNTFTGDSVAYWERDGVLVVETVSLDPNNELIVGLKQGPGVRVVERIYRKGNKLYNDMTIHAPDILDKAWSYQAVFEHRDERIADYPCSDNRISRNAKGEPVFDISLPEEE